MLGDTLSYMVYDDGETPSDVQGGLGGRRPCGCRRCYDRWRVGSKKSDKCHDTLLGRWTSIDKDFEIEEGGTVKSAVKAESTPWTYWKIFNGRLVPNKDTFDVAGLGADSLYLRTTEEYSVYKKKLIVKIWSLFRCISLGAVVPCPRCATMPLRRWWRCREKQFMVDCGEGMQVQLRRSKNTVSPGSTPLFISHIHGDHCFGLIGMISTFNLLGRTAPLAVYGPAELQPIRKPYRYILCVNGL